MAVYTDWGWLDHQLCQRLPAPMFSSTSSLLAVLALPHLLYAFVWLAPGVWRRTFRKQSVPVFAWLGATGKVMQFGTVFLWAWASQPTGVCLRRPLAAWQLVLGGVMVGYGQALNIGTYRAIGFTGVYYGSRLGRSVPWVNLWPFSDIHHPQYLGSTLSIWGMLVLLSDALPLPEAVFTAVFWTGLYCASGLIEQYF
ncbi:hypothetical protein VaNZ11_003416 [Volvox africanus]|uniref:phosphatidyl-N-methylethanolamine N-methyltransferase n=1 Tax=Volvox africanus TaxID=51714 RepID=A0ABQ5RU58_9CHLO|nr:hypothetical protein VaNZ11_003416 [Volvox africanus]